MEVVWDDRHQSPTSLLWQLSSSFVLSLTEFMFGMEVSLDNRHQPHTLVAIATKVRSQLLLIISLLSSYLATKH